MSTNNLTAPSEPMVTTQQRTCRYGHGDLKLIDRLQGRESFVAIAWGFLDETRAAPQWVGPLQWHLCPVCGYMELVDGTPTNTIAHMKGQEHG